MDGVVDQEATEKPHLELRQQVIHAQVLHKGGEPLVQPEVRPPLHRHQIPEPLMREGKSDYSSGHDNHPPALTWCASS